MAPFTLMMKILAGNIEGTINDGKKNCFSDKISKTTKFKSVSFGSDFLTLEARLTFI